MSASPDPGSGSGPDGPSDHAGEPATQVGGLQALEHALRRHLQAGGSELAVRRAISEWCLEVRSTGRPPEKALIEFKRVLSRVVASLPDADDESATRRATLTRLVTLCIEAYYRD